MILKTIEVIARGTSDLFFGKLLFDVFLIFLLDTAYFSVNGAFLGGKPALFLPFLVSKKLCLDCLACRQNKLTAFNMVHHLSKFERMGSGCIIGHHAAYSGSVARGGIWTQAIATSGECCIELVLNDARLDDGDFLFIVDGEDFIEMHGSVDHKSLAKTAPGNAGSSTTSSHGHLMFVGNLYGRD